MSRILVAVAAVSGLMLTSALAQQSGSSSMTSGSAARAQPITTQSQDQWLASKLKGTDVLGEDNKKIGDVSDVLVDRSGKVDGLIVQIGGFLGIGSKEIALPMSAFQFVRSNESGATNTNEKLKLSMSKEQLQQMAEFKPLGSSATTTGSGTAPANNSSAPAGSR